MKHRRYVIVAVGTPVYPSETDGGVSNTAGILGMITEDNAYLTAYPSVEGRPIEALEPWERTRATYRLSGTVGTYDVVRVSDVPE